MRNVFVQMIERKFWTVHVYERQKAERRRHKELNYVLITIPTNRVANQDIHTQSELMQTEVLDLFPTLVFSSSSSFEFNLAERIQNPFKCEASFLFSFFLLQCSVFKT